MNQTLPTPNPHPPKIKPDTERIAELERRLMESERVVVELRRQGTSNKDKLDNLTKELEDRVKCPVCLEMPSSGPIFTCPRGHCICKSCYQGINSSCPVCRTKMPKATSLLAVTVIEQIEHRCRNHGWGCSARLSLSQVEAHRVSCSYRLVACPAYSCKKQISYTAVKEHIFGDCTNSFASVTKKSHAVLDDRYIQRYTFEREFSFKVSTFFWSGKYFFLSIIKGDRPYANFYVQMLGDEEECRKLLVTLSVRDQDSDSAHSYCGHPLTMDLGDQEKEGAGLMVGHAAIMNICRERPGVVGKKFIVVLDFKHVDAFKQSSLNH